VVAQLLIVHVHLWLLNRWRRESPRTPFQKIYIAGLTSSSTNDSAAHANVVTHVSNRIARPLQVFRRTLEAFASLCRP
jgi:hypothetical protein